MIVAIRGELTTDRDGARVLVVGTWLDGRLTNVSVYHNPKGAQ